MTMPASRSPSRLGVAVVQMYILIRPLLPSAGVAKFALFVPRARQQGEVLLCLDTVNPSFQTMEAYPNRLER